MTNIGFAAMAVLTQVRGVCELKRFLDLVYFLSVICFTLFITIQRIGRKN